MRKPPKKLLFIQIPCFNEGETLASVIADLPTYIEGIDEIYTLIIDDGSTDNTVEVARNLGVDYIVQNNRNLGLAKSFSKGLEAALYLGADIIVNTDGDNQYKGHDIVKLVEPIVNGTADVVVGCRDIDNHKEFSWLKRTLQKFGSNIVRRISGTKVQDATSGFRAMSREAAVGFSFMSDFSYTLEMLVQAGRTGLKVACVPISVNPKLRDSRLFRSNLHFIKKQLRILLKVYLFYCPLRFFGLLAATFFTVSVLLSARIMYHLWYFGPEFANFKKGTAVLLTFTSIMTMLSIISGLLGAFLSGLRFLLDDIKRRIRNTELKKNIHPFGIEIHDAKNFMPEKQSDSSEVHACVLQ